MLTMSTGYFLYDTLSMWWLKILNFDNILHHTLVILAFTYTLVVDVGSYYNCLACFGGEFSNASMHIRGILRSLNMRYTKLYDVIQIIFISSYLFARIFLGHPIVYVTWACDSNPFVIKLCSAGIIIQSYYNIYKIYFVIKGVMKQSTELKQRGIEMKWFEPLSEKELEKCDFYKQSLKKTEEQKLL